MTTLVWLAASSLVWGGVLWGAAMALQSGNDLSGQMRQWIWRGVAVLLVMPWLAVPVVGMVAPDLSGSVAPPAELTATMLAADTPITDSALNMAAGELASRAWPGAVIPWVEILVAIVVAGWLLRMAMVARAARHLGRIISGSRPGEGPSVASVLRWSRRLGMRRAPELRVAAASTSPFSTGMTKPLVCLPEGIEQSMHAETLDLVIGHECIHVARGDGWRRPLERSIADVMWFNPFAWAIRRELDLARELACDEAVVAASSQRKAYARTLRVVAGMSAALPASAPAASMSLAGSGRLLAMRMKRTLDAATPRPAKVAIAGAVMLAFAATPMAIAQAILIEAVQPPDAPAPPAPPASPSINALAIAPQPPAPPKAPEHVQVSADGAVRVNFAARVAEAAGGPAEGYRAVLLQTTKNATGETCSATVSGLSSLSVSKGQALPRGVVIGQRGKSGSFGVSVTCSDEVDLRGLPKAAEAVPSPPAPPSPVSAVAPVAPVPPVSAVAAARPTPAAPPAPSPQAAPFTSPRPTVGTTPVTPAVPAVPVTPSSRSTTPNIAPAPPTPPAPPATPIQFTPGVSEPILEGAARRTSRYGERIDPFSGEKAKHNGIDLAQEFDSPVRSPANAVVTFAGPRDGYGNLVELAFAYAVQLRFAQLSKINVRSGDRVTPGQVIGLMGASGSRATGPHLHLEVLRDGNHIDPEDVEGLVLFGG